MKRTWWKHWMSFNKKLVCCNYFRRMEKGVFKRIQILIYHTIIIIIIVIIMWSLYFEQDIIIRHVILCHLILTLTLYGRFYYLFYRQENWGLKKLSNLLKVTELINGGTGIQNQTICFKLMIQESGVLHILEI